MEPSMYYAAKEGNIRYLRQRVEASPDQLSLTTFLTRQKDTVLHIAAFFEQTEFIHEVLRLEPALLHQANAKGDTPLHIAAASKNATLFPLLIEHYRTDLENGQSSSIPLWRAGNSEGNTALHEAIRNKRTRNALQLLEDPPLASCVNEAGESPLYLAADMALLEVVSRILDIRGSGDHISMKGPNGQTPLHAAASRQANEIARLLCREIPHIVPQTDNFGRTALHHCVSFPANDTAALLLEVDYKLAYIADMDGFTPLLTATSVKRWDIVGIILRYCPDCAQLCDNTGQNVLHLTIRERLRPMHVINHPEIRRLLNESDNNMNTPLHLAINSGFYSGAVRLLRCEDINLRVRNKDGLTALDLLDASKLFTIKEHMNVANLMRSRDAIYGGKNLCLDPHVHYELPNLQETKELANTLLVVSTLVCAITFAAAFTFPGGYDNSNGSPLLGKKLAFQLFFMSDAAAIFGSLSSTFILVWGIHWGSLGEPRHLYEGIRYAQGFLFVSFVAAMNTFAAGMYLVTVEKCMWLTICIFLAYSKFVVVTIRPFLDIMAGVPRYFVWLVFDFLPGDPTLTVRNILLSRGIWEDRIEEFLGETLRPWVPNCKKYNDNEALLNRKGNC